ncbi:hypothetical protein M5K25_026429 [Dendrobium thyrsiflorum]|uniref:Uncharacterized protein n=1 Tax=Dendrobium thyrsiflorum TaxID=117978 RepID=A0ABD0TXJ7_DENTH
MQHGRIYGLRSRAYAYDGQPSSGSSFSTNSIPRNFDNLGINSPKNSPLTNVMSVSQDAGDEEGTTSLYGFCILQEGRWTEGSIILALFLPATSELNWKDWLQGRHWHLSRPLALGIAARLRSFDDVPFPFGRKLRQLDRKQRRKLDDNSFVVVRRSSSDVAVQLPPSRALLRSTPPLSAAVRLRSFDDFFFQSNRKL